MPRFPLDLHQHLGIFTPTRVDLNYTQQTRVCPARLTVIAQVRAVSKIHAEAVTNNCQLSSSPPSTRSRSSLRAGALVFRSYRLAYRVRALSLFLFFVSLSVVVLLATNGPVTCRDRCVASFLTARKPQLHATYGLGFIRLLSKKPKALFLATTAFPLLMIAAPATSVVRQSVNATSYMTSWRTAAKTNSSRLAMLTSPPPSSIKKLQQPPLLFIHDKGRSSEIWKQCESKRIVILSARNTARGLKIQPVVIPDFRNLSVLFAKLNVAYHSYFLKEEREFCVVLPGESKELPIEEVKEDLLVQNLLVQSVRRITNRAREWLDFVLVTANTRFVDNAIKRALYNTKSRARYVKCLGDHGTTACTRNKDTDGPTACVLCKPFGHTANYLGCPQVHKRKINLKLTNNNKAPHPLRPRSVEQPRARSRQIYHTRKQRWALVGTRQKIALRMIRPPRISKSC
ncbi:hypothetical protein EVAR_49549_1 [Eumeta japonica]|uniref:Nucleic-acid-binding protein from transposon X-element n=1 Tax=Eumeta variegata TaxID=151549 RepID=A0A4C1XHX1_EUMVA|nr:hypothetical protein EVAR_49549_1 [Eumeta japonica]